MATDWGYTEQLVGTTPGTINGTSFDSPIVMNVTFDYTGAVVQGGANGVTFSGFQVDSLSDVLTNGTFTSQATKDIGSDAGTTDSTVGPVPVPGTIPEPTTTLLVGGGLLAVSLFRRRKTSKH